MSLGVLKGISLIMFDLFGDNRSLRFSVRDFGCALFYFGTVMLNNFLRKGVIEKIFYKKVQAINTIYYKEIIYV